MFYISSDLKSALDESILNYFRLRQFLATESSLRLDSHLPKNLYLLQ